MVDQNFDSLSAPPTSVAPGDAQIIYHSEFSFDPSDTNYSDPIFNHIPIDPILDDALVVTKRALKLRVTRGSFVPYTLTFRNNLPAGAPLQDIELSDLMPPGFSYVPGSATIDGSASEPTVQGRVLSWPNTDFSPGETKTLKLILIAGIGVGEGKYDNTGYGVHGPTGRVVSNRAIATVLITPDPIFDCPDVIGKVFDDKNREGYQDEGEEGLPGIKVVTARGWVVTTDQHGRYHITCPIVPNEAIGSNFVVKLDERSLPTGYRMTSENPRIMRLTRGKMSQIDFGASIDQVLRIEFSDSAFIASTNEFGGLKKEWKEFIRAALQELRQKTFRVRLSYWNTRIDEESVEARLDYVEEFIKNYWEGIDQGEFEILFERNSVRKGEAYEIRK